MSDDKDLGDNVWSLKDDKWYLELLLIKIIGWDNNFYKISIEINLSIILYLYFIYNLNFSSLRKVVYKHF